ncbi:MAG TPA: ester cyclase [Chloroflexota bacterium]
MSTEQNKSVVRRFYEDVLNEGNISALPDVAVQDYVEHNPLPGQSTQLQGLRDRVIMLRSAFQPRFAVEDIIAEGDRVAVRWTQTATHVGPFQGIPATGTSITLSGMDFYVLKDGRMAEHWDQVDLLGLLQQLGVIPQPEASVAP